MRSVWLVSLMLVVGGCGGADRSADAERACVEAARDKAGAAASVEAARVDRKDQQYTVQGSIQRGDRRESFVCVAGPPAGDDRGRVTATTVFIGKQQTPVGAG